MNILNVSPELNTAMKAAVKTDRGWEIERGKTMGGDFYRELTDTYGAHGIQVALIGGGITITWESPAHADLDELHAQLRDGRAAETLCDECEGDQDVRDYDNDGLWSEVEALCRECRAKAGDVSAMTPAELRKHDEAKADENEAKAAQFDAKIDDVRPNTILPAPVDGGGDPEGINDKRRMWGHMLAEECKRLTGTHYEDAVSDAIGYLLHVAAEYSGETPARAIERAVLHFNDETYGENIAAE